MKNSMTLFLMLVANFILESKIFLKWYIDILEIFMKLVNLFFQVFFLLVIVLFLIYFLTGYDSAFEADQYCHSYLSSYDDLSDNYGCDHDRNTSVDTL